MRNRRSLGAAVFLLNRINPEKHPGTNKRHIRRRATANGGHSGRTTFLDIT